MKMCFLKMSEYYDPGCCGEVDTAVAKISD